MWKWQSQEKDLTVTRRLVLCKIKTHMVRRVGFYEEHDEESTVSLDQSSSSETEENRLCKLVNLINDEL